MVARKDHKELDADTAKALAAGYRNGVDISDEEVAARFEADGYDAAKAMALVGEEASEDDGNNG